MGELTSFSKAAIFFLFQHPSTHDLESQPCIPTSPMFSSFSQRLFCANIHSSYRSHLPRFHPDEGVTYERYYICTSKRDRFRKVSKYGDVTKGCGFLAVSLKSCRRFYKYTQYFPLVIILEQAFMQPLHHSAFVWPWDCIQSCSDLIRVDAF